MSLKEELLNGECNIPEVIVNSLVLDNPEKDINNLQDFWEDLFHSYLNESNLCTTVYMDRFENEKLFNSVLYLLSKLGIINSDVSVNYGTITMLDSFIERYLTKEQIRELRMKYKLGKYMPRSTSSYVDNLVLVNKKLTKSGLVRKGFAKIYQNRFSYDIKVMEKYLSEIANEILKGITTSTKDLTYDEVVIELLAIISSYAKMYTTEKVYLDSRGRSIFQCQKRVFNPVSHKTARALLVIPSQTILKSDIDTMNSIFAFIAELNGFKGIGLTYAQKAHTGQNMHSQRYISDKADLHERIWLERIYSKLEELDKKGSVQWNIPIELDATASALMFLGVLTNNHEYMKRTNVIGDTLDDAWHIEGIERTKVKKFITRQMYGSTISAKDTMVELKLKHTQEDINNLNKLVQNSIFTPALKIKDYVISNAKFEETTHIEIGDDKFFVKCNKFKWGITERKVYKVYTSSQGLIKRITRNMNLVPDLKRFKRYAQTLLIHNLDSQVANYVCEKFDKWLIPNHDAFLVHPLHNRRVKELYAEKLYDIYTKRHEILTGYFKSIGINCTGLDMCRDELKYEDFNQETILK